jgi:hypothetical protein
MTHWWIDVIAVAIGAELLLRLTGRIGRRSSMQRPYELVPANAVAAHRELVAAAARPGVEGGDHAIPAGDVALLEIAALLGGREPRGGAQRRFVAARIAAMQELTAELAERADAWAAARDEVGKIAVPLEAPAAQPRVGFVVRALTVVLLPAFLALDLFAALGGLGVAIVDGVVLRVRALLLLAGHGLRSLVAAVARAREQWARARAAAREALAEARARAAASRMRLRLRLRRVRRVIRDQRPYRVGD